MPTKRSILNWLEAHTWAVYALVFLVFLAVHVFIFRDILAAIPQILQGNSIVVREELVPFFNFSTQFWPDGTSALSSSEEIRVVYSFWTSWVRHWAVLPFALVILNTISAFILFYAFYRIGRYFAGRRRLAVLLTAMLAAFLIHFILLYSKITHFYTLIFGFSLFALSLSMVLEQLYFKRDLSKRNIVAATLLVLLNPAIHYHVIFYFVLAFLVLVHIAFTVMLNRAHAGFYLKRNLIYLTIVTLASLLPYAAFIFIAGGSATTSAAENIPINYWMIYYSSLGLLSLFSFDTAAQIDMFRYGMYVIPSPRLFGMVVTFVIGAIFIMRQWRATHIAKRVFLLSLFITFLMAIWMAMGYHDSATFSFHSVVGTVAMYLTDQSNALAQLAGQGIATFINILRFPHRFQFIFFYIAGLLFMVGLLWVGHLVSARRGRLVAALAVVLVATGPILIARDYFLVLTSGNFANFLQPYQISPDLKQIKGELARQQNDKLFILPTLESGRDLNANGKRYGFIDKFLFYYLDQPTLYYGTGGGPENKVVAYAIYRAIEDGQPWWEDLLVHSLGVTHILQPKQAEERPVGFSYMPGIDKKIDEALNKSELFTKTFDGPDFALYQATTQPDDTNVLADMQWDELGRRLSGEVREGQCQLPENSQTETAACQQIPPAPITGRFYLPVQLQEFLKTGGEKSLVTDNPERSFYNLYSALNPKQTFAPNTVQLAFTKELVASSSFTNNALSMSTLNNSRDKYNYLGARVPSLTGTLTSQFIGVAGGNTGIQVNFYVPKEGRYRLLVHAASQADEIVGAVNNRGTVFKKIAGDRALGNNFIDLSYYYADIDLRDGRHNAVLHNPDSALLVEGLTAAPTGHMPNNFTDTVSGAGIKLVPFEEIETYWVELRDGQ